MKHKMIYYQPPTTEKDPKQKVEEGKLVSWWSKDIAIFILRCFVQCLVVRLPPALDSQLSKWIRFFGR